MFSGNIHIMQLNIMDINDCVPFKCYYLLSLVQLSYLVIVSTIVIPWRRNLYF